MLARRQGRLPSTSLWSAASGAAKAPGGGEARLGALSDQAALEFRQRAKHVKTSRPCAVVVSRASVGPRNPMLRGRDSVRQRVEDVFAGGRAGDRATVIQKKNEPAAAVDDHFSRSGSAPAWSIDR